jgi:hypothetical protein
MGGDLIGAFYFIPLARRPASDDELFDRLGVDRETADVGPFTVVQRSVDILSDHVCAQLYFLSAELINLRVGARDDDLPLERDPALPFAIAFRDGAARVDADVAILATHNPSLDAILERYWMVQTGDATTLAAEYFGLLYLDDSQVLGWRPPDHLLDRDKLPGGPGLTLFAGKGRSRWY